jgi:uncharacterized protein
MRMTACDINESGSIFEFSTPADRFPILREMVQRGECEFNNLLRTRLRAVRIGDLIEVEGETQATVRLTCGRCLAEFATVLTADIALTYAQRVTTIQKPGPSDTAEDLAEESDVTYFQGEDIDLTAGIQEQIILSMPLKPLCSESCKGLCPHCGADLNQAGCTCLTTTTKGPFDVLSRLKLEKR